MKLIDKDALIRKLKPIREEEIRLHGRSGNKGCCTLSTALYEIEFAPTIEERKTGKWIIEPYDVQNDIWVHRCGVCMKVTMLGGHTTRFKFCPNCGSAMEGEQT